MGFPLTEYWSFGGRYSLIKDRVALDKSTFYTDPDGTGPLPAVCDPLKAGRYLCDEIGIAPDLVGRLFDALRRYRRHPSDARPAAHLQPGFRRALAATSATFAPPATRPSIRASAAAGSSRPTARAASSRPLQKSPGHGPRRDPPDRPLLRSSAARLRHSRHRPADPARALQCRWDARDRPGADHRRARRQGLLHGPARARIPGQLGLKSVGLRPSVYVDAGSLWSITKPQLTDVVASCTPKTGTTGLAGVHQPQSELQHRLQRRCARHRQIRLRAPASRKSSSAIRRKPRAFDRHRRQLGFALRPAAPRPRQGAAQAKGRRHQTLQLQRRNIILMKKLLVLAASLRLRSWFRLQPAPRPFPPRSSRSSISTRSPADCNACKTATAALRGQGHRAPEPAKSAGDAAPDRRQSRSRPRSTR